MMEILVTGAVSIKADLVEEAVEDDLTAEDMVTEDKVSKENEDIMETKEAP